MTPTRRTRKSGSLTNATVKRISKSKTESSDEDSSDSGSTTRCICGDARNVGLMVQCEECEVWQHCECMGLDVDKLPDHYYCDKCKPEHHQLIKSSTGRSKRFYNASLVSNNNNNLSPSITNSEDDNNNNTNSNKKRTLKKRKKPTDSPSTSTIDTPILMNDTILSNVILKDSPSSILEELDDEPIKSRRLKNDEILIEALPTRKKSPTQDKKPSNQQHLKKLNTNNSPIIQHNQLIDDLTQQHQPSFYWNFMDGKPIRESSPPAKVKYPNSKMSFTDMNKRAKQLMDCLSKIQAEELKKSPSINSLSSSSSSSITNEKLNVSNTPPLLSEDLFNRPRSLSTCSSSSSLSSASTVPLIDHNPSSPSSPSTPMPYLQQQESSLEILERISRELVKFKRKFGVLYQHIDISVIQQQKKLKKNLN